ncbi:hypothetical protein GCM10011578_057550 [Streptomyces fuscichromogenes]|uniref:Uncharacterized protein n=1 Tax=Streptomyces fuscichromogenes TaxID=1324013 RepID=A0A917XGV2_9ACTN|nr:hypothetical protein GCM10011578_057550 [Streptomyces fuscichromogenes]
MPDGPTLQCAPCPATDFRARRIPVGSQNGDRRGASRGGNAGQYTAPSRGKEDRGKEDRGKRTGERGPGERGGSNASLESPAG